jgi:hypothetical protein
MNSRSTRFLIGGTNLCHILGFVWAGSGFIGSVTGFCVLSKSCTLNVGMMKSLFENLANLLAQPAKIHPETCRRLCG